MNVSMAVTEKGELFAWGESKTGILDSGTRLHKEPVPFNIEGLYGETEVQPEMLNLDLSMGVDKMTVF